MGGGSCWIFVVFKDWQFRTVVWGAERHYYLFIVAIYFNDRLYYRGYTKQRKNFGVASKKTNKKIGSANTLFMKTIRLKSSLLVGVAVLLLLFPWLGKIKNHTLTDVVKPYLGFYECRLARLNEQDYLQDFSYVRLELKPKGSFTVTCKTKEGEVREADGSYEYDGKKEVITFYSKDIPFVKRECQIKNGVIFLTVPIGNKMLVLEFEQM